MADHVVTTVAVVITQQRGAPAIVLIEAAASLPRAPASPQFIHHD